MERPIEVYVFGDGPKTALVMAGVHGDEFSGVEVAQSLISALSAMPMSALVGMRVVVMPLANPDGYAACTRQNAREIDINRNFPGDDFGAGAKEGPYYGGEAAASEPETQAIMDVVTRHEPWLIISLHAPLACVNYNGPSLEVAQRISQSTGLPPTGDIGYPTPGSMGNYYGRDRRLPLITLELPKDDIDPGRYAEVLLEAVGVAENPESRSYSP